MCNFAERLRELFPTWDAAIEAEKLREVLQGLNADFTAKELDLLVDAADRNQDGLVDHDEFADFVASDVLARVAGARLPEGTYSDKRLDRLEVILSKLSDSRFNARSWLSDLQELLNPETNPAGFKIIQDAAVAQRAPEVLVAVVQRRASDVKKDAREGGDLIRSTGWQCLGLLAFGNEAAGDAVASVAELAVALRSTMKQGAPPEQLSALQMVQAIAAASGDAVSAAMPALLAEVAPLIRNALGEAPTPEATVMCSSGSLAPVAEQGFDVMVSCSFAFAGAVAEKVGWPQLARLVSAGERRPEWLPAEPLQLLLSGRLAANLASEPRPSDEADARVWEEMALCLGHGHFLSYYMECLEAAVSRREWPNGLQAYHSPTRMAELAGKLAALGYRRQLIPAMEHLARAIEVSDEQTTRAALRALRALCDDVACLMHLLKMEGFRSNLNELCRDGEDAEASELLGFIEGAELSLQGAQAVLDAGKVYIPNAPSVQRLAEIFVLFASLEQDLSPEQLKQAVAHIPLAPSVSVQTSEGGKMNLSFLAFSERVYGTPAILGWWPSLMEDAAAYLEEATAVPYIPSLTRAVDVFEAAAQGKSTVHGEAVFETVLPSLGLPTEGKSAIVDELTAIRELGGVSLDFKEFVAFLVKFCAVVRDEELAEAATEA